MQLRPLMTLGTISYSVYLIPPINQDLIKMAGFSGVEYILLLVPLPIACAHLTYRYIERPAIAYSKIGNTGQKRSQGSEVPGALPANKDGGVTTLKAEQEKV
ncbi:MULTISPECIES: acyltransferase family protein [Paraburkholderia]|uniref:Peptidoglycan/LPS O-acetylase OafA/YrhL n=2 Tax=Paraburkholderia TaxID=1822464 RepID=A0A7Y9WSB9_9BURK|nr:hypothetical protein [Paraburkholderia bryophila]NYH25847.1 peptidoglycan/LPS O-acetylase OafA/YrhL [Paraburkholderia bryophila]